MKNNSLVRLSWGEINYAPKGVVFLLDPTNIATTNLKPDMITPRI